MIDPWDFFINKQDLGLQPWGEPVPMEIYGPPVTPDVIQRAEQELGVKLPDAYLELIKGCNGGYLKEERSFITPPFPLAYHGDQIEFRQIPGIGYEAGIDAPFGSKYLCAEWEYPPEDCVWLEGDGHWCLLMDNRQCGPEGEPSILFADSEAEPMEFVTIAYNFRAFLNQLSPAQH